MSLLKPREIADHYRVSVDTVYRWIRDGRIRAENIGTARRPRWRIERSALNREQPTPLKRPGSIKEYV